MTFLRIVSAAMLVMVTITTAQAADKLGIVLMHGKQGNPDRGITNLASALESAGYLVARPEMCWSKRRIYDKPYPACLAELDKVIADLKADGATAIVLAGHSLGGNGAIAYTSDHAVKGVISLAGAHYPERSLRRPEIAASLAKAQAMVADGHGTATANFDEINADWTFTVSCSAETYVSFFDPIGPAAMSMTMSHIHAPILWVAGDRDRTQKGVDELFAKAPPDPLNRLVTVSADHMATPDLAVAAVTAWLNELAAR